MAGPGICPGQSVTLACNSMAPVPCSSSSLCSPSSSGSFSPLPSCPPSRFYGFSQAGAASSLVGSACSCSASPDHRRPVRTSRAIRLRSSFVSKSLDSNFFNGGGGAIILASTLSNSSGGGALGAFMNIFERIVRIVRSYANAIVSAAEDPEKILDQTVLEMNEDLVKMRQATAQVLASQKQLENKYKTAQQNADDWYKRAKLALQKGEENLAREALKRRKDYEENANALKAQLEQQKTVVEKLISSTRLLESKIQEAKSKKDTLKARAQSAKTATKVNEMLGNINTSSALSAFERMEEKVSALEAEADALNQLSTDDLAGKFALLESNAVDDDLTALKKEISGSSKRPSELPAGRSAVSSGTYPFKDAEVEKELNELRRKVSEY